MSLVYFMSKFSQEAILLELFLIACISTSYFGYLLIKKRKYGAAKRNIPDNVIRTYLIEMISQAEGFKNQLFGENLKIEPTQKQFTTHAVSQLAAGSGTNANAAELLNLQTQLSTSLAKQEELNAIIKKLNSEKQNLQEKASAAGSATTAAAAGDQEIQEKISSLEARLAEYEVIEDDLANLKRYQQENKQLKAELEQLKEGGGAPAAAATPAAEPAAAPAATPAPVETAAAAPTPAPLEAAPAETPVATAPAAPAPAVEATQPAPEAAEQKVETKPAPEAQTKPQEQQATPAAPASPSPIDAAEASVDSAQAEKSLESLNEQVEETISAAPVGASVKEAVTPPAPSSSDAPPIAAPEVKADEKKSDKSDEDLLNEFEKMLSS